MTASAADESFPQSFFGVSWGEREVVSVSSVSGLRLDADADGVMRPSPVELTRTRSVDDAFETWAADPEPQSVTVTVMSAAGSPALTFLLEDAVPVSYIALDGLDADSPRLARETLVVRCCAIRRVST